MAKGHRNSRSGKRDLPNRSIANRISTVDLPLSNHINYLNTLLTIQRRVASQALAHDRRLFNPGDPLYHRLTRQPYKLVTRSSIVERTIRRPGLSTIHVVGPGARHKPTRGVTLKYVLDNRIGFDDPRRVMICVRRQRRKEVMHALRFAGGRGRRRTTFRQPRRNYYSGIDC